MQWTWAVPVLGMLAVVAGDQSVSQGYRIWVSVQDGRCTYWLTDTGMDARQLTEALGADYDTSRGAVILTSGEIPQKCVQDAVRAARQAGFTTVSTREGNEKDRLNGIP